MFLKQVNRYTNELLTLIANLASPQNISSANLLTANLFSTFADFESI